jgi:hypothetical protein
MLQEVHSRFPVYLFARTALAQLLVQAGELDKARATLDPILARPRLHFSEFTALCGAEIELALAKGQRQGAKSWLEMWERAVPNHPQLPLVRRRVRARGWLGLGR